MVTEGEQLRIKRGKSLPPSLLQKVKENKQNIIETMTRDNSAKLNGFLIGLSGKLYTKSLNHRSNVYIEQIGDKWEAWRESYQKGQRISTKSIATGTFDEVIEKAKSYFEFMERKRGN
ncbi:hypothetical protein [Pseudalkalibacillus decolorationis]|uniref:hypothetical protein n=1 Tax=Pseudalkalibacillus decolorationis TaxID=163879 RepID=UPI002148B9E1|nr:hypothetical protein [Pseudalkalibacillus decolorationis]